MVAGALLMAAAAAGDGAGPRAGGAAANGVPPALPSSRQVEYMGWGKEMFVHFSITTFTASQAAHQNASLFAPPSASLNVSQWVEAAVRGGFPVATLTTKHEAGFSIWPTKHNPEYSILQSPTGEHGRLQATLLAWLRPHAPMPMALRQWATGTLCASSSTPAERKTSCLGSTSPPVPSRATLAAKKVRSRSSPQTTGKSGTYSAKYVLPNCHLFDSQAECSEQVLVVRPSQ